MKTKKRAAWPVRVFFALIRLSLALGCAALAALCLYAAATAPDLDNVTPHGYRTSVLDDAGNEILILAGEESNRIYIPLWKMSRNLQNAFIAIEDQRFYTHHGIDLQGIARAAVKNLLEGRLAQGASTLTQQLIKNNLFSSGMEEKTAADKIKRKIQEQYLALKLERGVTKAWILENYLNTINLGGGTWGVQTAAQRYFGKDAADLELSECAVLAAIAGNPTAFHPVRHPEANRQRQLLVLSLMRQQGFISTREYERAQEDPVYERIQPEGSGAGPAAVFSWFQDAAVSQAASDLERLLGWTDAWDALYRGGLTIETTQNSALQAICEEEIGAMDTEAQASVVMLDPVTGAVKAVVGGRGEKTGSLAWNRAVSAVRQPGSTLKVVGEYAAALEARTATLATVFDDAPAAYSDGTPIRNAGEGYGGRTSLRAAIASSVNTVALRCFRSVGLEAVWQRLERFGFSHLDGADMVESLALGGTHGGVTNLELTAAYGAIANGGIRVEPYFYYRIRDREGNILLEKLPILRTAAQPETAALLTSALEDVMTKGTGTEANVPGIRLAGKSGTTSDRRDLWFVGFSPRIVCGLWTGNDNFTPQSADGASVLKRTWGNLMRRAHEGQALSVFGGTDPDGGYLRGGSRNRIGGSDAPSFALIEGLEKRTVCAKCGNLAVPGLCDETVQGDMAVSECFAPGTVPVQSCDCHIRVEFCNGSGDLAGLYCRQRTGRIYLRTGTAGTADAGAVPPEKQTCTQHRSWMDWLFPWEYPEEDPPPEPPGEDTAAPDTDALPEPSGPAEPEAAPEASGDGMPPF